MEMETSISAALAEFVSKFRREHGLTLDQVARKSRDYGAKWSGSSIKNIENGSANTSLTNLLVLGLALNDLADTKLTLSDMLGDAKAFDIPRGLGLPVTRAWVNNVLNGAELNIGHVSNLVGGEDAAEKIIRELPARIKEFSGELPPDMDLEELEKVESREPTLAEERAAAKLGIRAAALRAWARHLWGKDLEERAAELADESAAKTGKPVTPQTRGAMTRKLIQEIANAREGEASGTSS